MIHVLPARASSLCPFHLHAPYILATNHDDASLLRMDGSGTIEPFGSWDTDFVQDKMI